MWESKAKTWTSGRVQSRHDQAALVHVRREWMRRRTMREREEPGTAARRPKVQRKQVTKIVGLYRGEQPQALGWRVQGTGGGVCQPGVPCNR